MDGATASSAAILEANNAFDVREDLLAQRRALSERIARFPTAAKPLVKPADPERRETHWDFLLKEMMWMATDFETERKRHGAMLKQRSKQIMGYWRHKENEERQKVRCAIFHAR